MKEILRVEKKQDILALITNIAYADVPAWWGSSRKNLHMNLVVPKVREEGNLRPTVIFICGGAFLDVDNAVWLPPMMYFAKKGFNIATIEYRTSNEEIFPAPLCDVKAAIRFLKAHAVQYCVDTEHIFVMGESAGGSMAGLVGVTAREKEFDQGDFLEYDSSVCGVVDFYGVSKVTVEKKEEKTHLDLPYWVTDSYMGLGYTEDMAKRASTISYVTPDTPPFFILHGDKDDMVDISHSEELYEALQKNGVKSTYLVLEGAEHGDDAFYQEEIFDRILEFMKECMA